MGFASPTIIMILKERHKAGFEKNEVKRHIVTFLYQKIFFILSKI